MFANQSRKNQDYRSNNDKTLFSKFETRFAVKRQLFIH
jgi:hypothetical protein